MNELGHKIALKRKEAGMTQNAFADSLNVTRQTVSRWEAGTVLPDIDKISDIAALLNVSCDYLLRDDISDDAEQAPQSAGISRLLRQAEGRMVKLSFFSEEADPDFYDKPCRILEFEGSWMKAEAETKKGRIEKLIPVSSVLSLEILEEDE